MELSQSWVNQRIRDLVYEHVRALETYPLADITTPILFAHEGERGMCGMCWSFHRRVGWCRHLKEIEANGTFKVMLRCPYCAIYVKKR